MVIEYTEGNDYDFSTVLYDHDDDDDEKIPVTMMSISTTKQK